MPFAVDLSAVAAYVQIVAINIVLSGDNVVVIGMAAASLAADLRPKAIASGIAVATVIRIVFAVLAVHLLAITGLLLAGGLLLLWVCWKMSTELRQHAQQQKMAAMPQNGLDKSAASTCRAPDKTLKQAVVQIIIADVSMSLDNVLAVAGAAKQNLPALVFGLILSVILMGFAASLVARLLNRYRWIGWIGLAIIVYIAMSMIYEGAGQFARRQSPAVVAQGFGTMSLAVA